MCVSFLLSHLNQQFVVVLLLLLLLFLPFVCLDLISEL